MQTKHGNFTLEFFTSRGESKLFAGLSSPLFYFLPLDLLLREKEREEKVMAALYTFPINLLLTCIKKQTRIQTQKYHKATFTFHHSFTTKSSIEELSSPCGTAFSVLYFSPASSLHFLDFLSIH